MKGLLHLVFLVLLAYSVSGQGLGEDLSLIVLLPLVLIIIVAILFGVTFIIDTKNYYVAKKTVNIPSVGKVTATEVVKEEVKVEETEKGEKKEEKVEKIWINYLDIVDTFAKKLDDRETDDAFKVLLRMIREFFKDRFNLDYEFTYDELLKEFEKRNVPNKEMIISLKESMYKDKKIDKKIIYDYSTKFREVIRIIDKEKLEEIENINIDKNAKFNKIRKMMHDIRKQEGRIDEKLNKLVVNEKKKIFSLNFRKKPKQVEVKKNFDEFDRDKLEQIGLLIKNGRISLEKKNLNKLREVYGDICYLFPFLSDRNKKIAYLEILEFYEDMNIKLFPKLYKEVKK
ncbi:MAG: hypothetical protein AABW58_03680 [Nanoarchaeota archaeon]